MNPDSSPYKTHYSSFRVLFRSFIPAKQRPVVGRRVPTSKDNGIRNKRWGKLINSVVSGMLRPSPNRSNPKHESLNTKA